MSLVGSLWQICFTSFILAFGIEIGLFSRLTKLKNKSFLLLCIFYSVILYIGTFLSDGHVDQLTPIIHNYIAIIYLLIAFIMIVVGLFIIKETNKNNPQISKFVIITNVAMFICCVTSIMINMIVVSTMIEITLPEIRNDSIHLISKSIKKSDDTYSRILGNYMLVFGEYFILSALIMPNISLALQKTNGITINSAEYLNYLFIVIIVLFIIGVILSRRKNILR